MSSLLFSHVRVINYFFLTSVLSSPLLFCFSHVYITSLFTHIYHITSLLFLMSSLLLSFLLTPVAFHLSPLPYHILSSLGTPTLHTPVNLLTPVISTFHSLLYSTPWVFSSLSLLWHTFYSLGILFTPLSNLQHATLTPNSFSVRGKESDYHKTAWGTNRGGDGGGGIAAVGVKSRPSSGNRLCGSSACWGAERRQGGRCLSRGVSREEWGWVIARPLEVITRGQTH